MEIKFNPLPLGRPHDCRVFIPNNPKSFDLSDLRRFGLQVIPLTTLRSVFPDEADAAEKTLIDTITQSLHCHRYNPDKDYIGLVGDPLITAAVMFTLGQMVDSATLLRYDGQSRSYWPFLASYNKGKDYGKSTR